MGNIRKKAFTELPEQKYNHLIDNIGKNPNLGIIRDMKKQRNLMNILKLTTLCALATTVYLAPSAQAELVYDNTTGFTASFNPGTIEVGDQIILAGDGRTITNFTLQYSGLNFSGTEQMQLRIYANDGPLVSGAASPGTELYNSGVFGIAPPPGGETLIFDDFDGWDGIVPDSFTWSIQFSNIGLGADPSISLLGPVPTVGLNYDDYWENNGGVWTLKEGATPVNFGARIEAVPEPSTIALGLLGGVAGLVAYRRQRR